MGNDQPPLARAVTRRALTKKPLSVRRATSLIVAVTVIVTIAGGVAIWLLDHKEYPDIGTSLWWAVQTVTTVGYGDVVPQDAVGRVIGTIVMVTGIGFIAVFTAAVTAALIEQARRRQRASDGADTSVQLDRIEVRLGAIETALAQPGQAPRPAAEPGEDKPS
jgi:voltage-gated potassium channel